MIDFFFLFLSNLSFPSQFLFNSLSLFPEEEAVKTLKIFLFSLSLRVLPPYSVLCRARGPTRDPAVGLSRRTELKSKLFILIYYSNHCCGVN